MSWLTSRPDAAPPCTTVDPDLFFPVRIYDRNAAEPAKAICRRCPVIRECLAYSLTNDVTGVWGGTDDDQRVVLRQRHNLHPQALDTDALFAAAGRTA